MSEAFGTAVLDGGRIGNVLGRFGPIIWRLRDTGQARLNPHGFHFSLSEPDGSPLHTSDADANALHFLYGDEDGATLWAPDCASDEEYERRVYCVLGEGYVIDDLQESVRVLAPEDEAVQ